MTVRPSLKVLVVTVVHDPDDARIRYRQMKAMTQAGYRVVYAAPFTAYGRVPPAGVTALDLPRARGRRRMAALWAARRLLARIGPAADVVLLHDPDLLPAVASLRLAGTPVVWDVHEDTAAAVRMRPWIPSALRTPVAAAVHAAEALAERRLHLLLAEHSYAGRFTRPHAVVPNSVEVPAALPAAVPPPNRAVYVGRLTRARGASELIEVAKALPEVRVEVFGPADAEVGAELSAAASAGILTWHGFVPNAEALARIPGALAGLSLLHDEPNYAWSQPTKLIEYMSRGLPVVTTPNPASVALVERAGAGAVVPFGAVDAVVDALRQLLGAPTLRQEWGRRGYELVRAELNWAADKNVFLDELERVAGLR